ncbi:S8 family serine peptidase [bacterium]|nr:S8 family serine peptidase [bacterium]
MFVKKNILSFLIVSLATTLANSAEIFRPKNENVITQTLSDFCETKNPEKVLVWVYFTDKGFRSENDLQKKLTENQNAVSERSLKRRAKEGKIGVNFQDLQLCQNYLDELKKFGLEIKQRSKWFNSVSLFATQEQLNEISKLTFVSKIDLVMRFKTDKNQVTETTSKLTNQNQINTLNYGQSYDQVNQINVIPLHDQGFSGAGVLVAMFDTGFMKQHVSFANADVVSEWDFIFNDANTNYDPNQDTQNQFVHGTGTWGTLGGFSEGNLIGPAYNSSFFLAKTENVASELQVEEDNWASAIEWADSIGVDVVSSSLGYLDFDNGFVYPPSALDGNTAITTIAADYAASLGIVVCNSAGNNGSGTSTLLHPSDADSILAIGAVDGNGTIAGFSSRGPTFDGRTKPEVCARGVGTTWTSVSSTTAFGTANGTSLSCPLVGGSVALLREAHPEWTVMQVRSALMNTASQTTTPDNDYGWGIVNVLAAMNSSPLVYPLPFNLTSPAQNSIISAPFVIFNWQATTDPDGSQTPLTYTLRVSASPNFPQSNTTTITGITTTSYALLPTTLTVPPLNTFYWKVLVTDDEGEVREARKVGKFTFNQTVLVPGDVDANGAADESDVLMILEHVAGVSVLTGEQLNAGDVDGDSFVRVNDASEILK